LQPNGFYCLGVFVKSRLRSFFSPAKGLMFVMAASACLPVCAQSPTYRFVSSDDVLQDRNAYLLTLIEADAAAREAVKANAELKAITERVTKTRDAVRAACKATTMCPVERLMLTDPEIDAAGSVLAKLAGKDGPLKAVAEQQMRPSGLFYRHANLDDAELVRTVWVETAHAINRIYRAYALNDKTVLQYSTIIDPMDIDPKDDYFHALLAHGIDDTKDAVRDPLFFSTWSHFASDILIANQRDNARRFEPLETGENAAAFTRAKTLDWTKFRYSVIVVPGGGLGTSYEIGLNPDGEFNTHIAARRWRDGLAPFILVSGGYVHPNHTPYAEAIEMKKALLHRFGVPESAIIVDPYARHTTTNLRNAARLIFRTGAPVDKLLLVSSHQDQSLYMGSNDFVQRCATELGYQPLKDVQSISPFDLSARINLESLEADALDPLDP
jgi:DUF218 domain